MAYLQCLAQNEVDFGHREVTEAAKSQTPSGDQLIFKLTAQIIQFFN